MESFTDEPEEDSIKRDYQVGDEVAIISYCGLEDGRLRGTVARIYMSTKEDHPADPHPRAEIINMYRTDMGPVRKNFTDDVSYEECIPLSSLPAWKKKLFRWK